MGGGCELNGLLTGLFMNPGPRKVFLFSLIVWFFVFVFDYDPFLIVILKYNQLYHSSQGKY